MMRVLKRPDVAGLVCAGVAGAIGIAYLLAAGAPARHVAINLAAFVVGLAAYATFVLPKWRLGAAAEWVLPGLGLVLLVATLVGTPVEGAARWVPLGPLSLQLSLILLPVMIVLFARRPSRAGAAGIGIAALALALQPDQGMAGVLAAAMLVLATRNRDRAVLAACAASLTGFGAAMVQPDALPAVPFVDQIFYSSFSIHPALGLALITGAGLMVVPGLLQWREGWLPGLVFATTWAGVSLAAALGNYPTPLVGYGGSAIVGYLLSLAPLGLLTAERGAIGEVRRPTESRDGPLRAASLA